MKGKCVRCGRRYATHPHTTDRTGDCPRWERPAPIWMRLANAALSRLTR